MKTDNFIKQLDKMWFKLENLGQRIAIAQNDLKEDQSKVQKMIDDYHTKIVYKLYWRNHGNPKGEDLTTISCFDREIITKAYDLYRHDRAHSEAEMGII